MRAWQALLAIGAIAWMAWLAWPGDEAAPSPRATAASDARPGAATAGEAPPPVPREAVPDGVARGEQAVAFTSEAEDGGPIAAPVRDGTVILLLDDRRRPRADARLDVRWRKGFGLYGNDRGSTDAQGRMATTVAEFEMIEGITCLDPELGELSSRDDFLPMVNDPRTVVCIVPALHRLTVRVVDRHGAAVPTATVTCKSDLVDTAPREYVLAAAEQSRGVDDDGLARFAVATGRHELRAEAPRFATPYTLRTDAAPGGTAVTLHLLANDEHHEVAIDVEAPGDGDEIVIEGFTSHVPPMPGLAAAGVEPVHREFAGRRTGPRRFVFDAPPMPWTCRGRAGRANGHVALDALATHAVLRLQLPVARPTARLRCRLLLPDGSATRGEVMVHTKPDLVYGPRYHVDPDAPWVEVDVGGTACVSGWVHDHAPVVAGPITLRAGEQDVELRVAAGTTIRGRVVDEQGRPVRAVASLLRPSGALQALGTQVPAILAHPASGDSRGTFEGAFEFARVGAGEHAVRIEPEAGWPALVRVQPGADDIVIRLGDGLADHARIHGRVTLAPTGTPIAGAEVRWCGPDASQVVYSAADGTYAVALPPGELHHEVLARRCAWTESTPRAFAAGVHAVDIAVEPSEPLFVRVRDERGIPVVVDITVHDVKGRELAFVGRQGNYAGGTVSTDDHGRAELGGLPHAPLRLVLTSEDETSAMEIDVSAGVRRDVDLPITWQPKPR